jgi:hypothetical protein
MDRVGSGEKHLEDCTVSKFVNSPFPMPKLSILDTSVTTGRPIEVSDSRTLPTECLLKCFNANNSPLFLFCFSFEGKRGQNGTIRLELA